MAHQIYFPKKFVSNNKIKEMYSKNITSQAGEDGMIEYIFNKIGHGNKLCMEFGANDGCFFSNTWNLLNNHNWGGLLVESNAEHFDKLSAAYAHRGDVVTLSRMITFEGENSLDNILTEQGFPHDFELLSVDIDGCDYHVLSAMELFSPKLIVVEYNPCIPNNVVFVQDKDFSVNHGSSLLAFVDLAKKKGYELIATTVINAFFIRKEYIDIFEIENNDIEFMNDDAWHTMGIFQLYDGSVRLFGNKKLIWLEIPIDDEDIQPLPKSLRKLYPVDFYGDNRLLKGEDSICIKNIDSLRDVLSRHERVMCFGFGSIFRGLSSQLDKESKSKIVAVVDNDRRLHQFDPDGWHVVPPFSIVTDNPDAIVMTSYAWKDMIELLSRLKAEHRLQFSLYHCDFS